MTESVSRTKEWLPHILVVFWMFFLGASIWQHAAESIQPPIYDPLGYIQKGKNLWANLEQGEWVNPLNVLPSSRPPGTVLVSYPFGYTADFRGFYFRSAFFPILCVVLSVYITVGLRLARLTGWGTAAVAFLISSLPMYYQFEMVEGLSFVLRWGLVDAFQGGVAALAAAALVQSVQSKSIGWLGAAAVFAVMTLMIKPSGAMVMLLLGAAWVIAVIHGWFDSAGNRAVRQRLKYYAWRGGCTFMSIYLVTTAFCVRSDYLSEANFAFADKVLGVQKGLLAISLHELPTLLHGSVGVPILLWSIALFICWVMARWVCSAEWQVKLLQAGRFWLFTALFWAGGVWYWLVVQAGGNQIRYFFPFFFMGLIAIVPVSTQLWLCFSVWFRRIVVVACLVPAANIALLLVQSDPSPAWQAKSGVSVSIGTTDEEVRAARDFLSEIRKSGKSVGVYAFSSGTANIVFENVGLYEWHVRPELPTYLTKLQLDWTRGLVTRIDELLAADYIQFRPVRGNDEIYQALQLERIDNFEQENRVFEAWLTGLSGTDGIRVAVNTPELRLIEQSDPELFKRRLAIFVADRTWRSEFIDANPAGWSKGIQTE